MKFLKPLHMIVLLMFCTAFFITPPLASASAPENKLSEIQETLKSKLNEFKENSKKEEAVGVGSSSSNGHKKTVDEFFEEF